MRILLVRPPTKHISGSAGPSADIPLGLLYIAAVLEKNNYTVDIYDAQVNTDNPVHHESDGSIHMGDRWKDLERQIANRKPDILGISCSFTAQVHNVIKTAEIAKKINKEMIVTVGGSPATISPDYFFSKTDAIDIVCSGEGEYTMVAVAESVKTGSDLGAIPGVATRDGESIKINPHKF